MARLIRMDTTGHSTLAEWTAGDAEAEERAVAEFRRQLDTGLLRDGHRGRGPGAPGRRAPARRRARDPAPPDRGRVSSAPALPETAAVHWRPRADARRLRSRGRAWTLTTVAHTVPFIATAGGMFALEPLSFPVGLAALAHAWAIPELYARRGANVVRPRPRGEAGAERVALGLLGDLVGHDARELHARTGLVPERGALGVWLVAEAGAVLVAHGGRRVFAWCVKVPEPRPALGRPHRPSAARAARRRGGLRHRRQPRVQRRAVAAAAADAAAHAGRRSTPGSVWPACRGPRCEDGVNGPCPIRACGLIMLSMPSTSARRLILVPAAASPRQKPPTPGVRRFRLAQLRLEGRDVPQQRALHAPEARLRLSRARPRGPGRRPAVRIRP